MFCAFYVAILLGKLTKLPAQQKQQLLIGKLGVNAFFSDEKLWHFVENVRKYVCHFAFLLLQKASLFQSYIANHYVVFCQWTLFIVWEIDFLVDKHLI